LSRRRIVLLLCLVAVVAAAAGLYRHYGASAPTSARQAKGGASGAGPAVPVTTALAQIEDFAIRRRTIGIIESPAIVLVKSRIESQVLEQHVKDGALVKKGDLLFTLDDREIQAVIARNEAQLAKDQASVIRTNADEQRYRQLSASNAGSRQQLDQAIADHKIALATVEADEAQLRSDRLRLKYTRIEAPIGGRIGAVRISPGNLVSANDPTGLVTITQIRPIRVTFTLAERDLAALRKASLSLVPVVVRVYAPGAVEPRADGVLDFVDSAVDSASVTIAAMALFGNETLELWPGMYVDVEIDLDVREKTVMIPTVAIQSGQQGPFVFEVKPDGRAEMRKIEVVGNEGTRAALVSGVSDGERVIVEGQMRLTDGTRVAEVTPGGGPRAGDAAGPKSAPGAKSAPDGAGASRPKAKP
jgi:multidrug efflux system membrane fusion protein